MKKELADRQDDNRLNINQTLKSFEGDINRALEKKANVFDVTAIVNGKSDAVATNLSIQTKANLSDFENLKLTVDKLSRENLNKLDFNKFDAYITDTRSAVEEIQRDLMMKANIKEMLNLLKNKSDIDDVNKALTQIHEELDAKTAVEQVRLYNNLSSIRQWIIKPLSTMPFAPRTV
jgi:hypothetical protein